MTLDQLEKFCAPKGFHPGAEWQEKPFRIGKYRVATDGHILVAESGFSPIKLPELEAGVNQKVILGLLAVKIPDMKYSTEHCLGFIGDRNQFTYEIPVLFSSQRVSREKLWKVMSVAGDSYRFTIINQCLYFQFGNAMAALMGMKNTSLDDQAYEPKLFNAKVSR